VHGRRSGEPIEVFESSGGLVVLHMKIRDMRETEEAAPSPGTGTRCAPREIEPQDVRLTGTNSQPVVRSLGTASLDRASLDCLG
jgi:hypothetical protein